MKVEITEGTLFRIFLISWAITTVLFTLISVFPFGFVFGAGFGIFVGFMATFLYVQFMSFFFGDRSDKEASQDKGFDFESMLGGRDDDRE